VLGYLPEDAYVGVGHGRVLLGGGIATTAARGRECGARRGTCRVARVFFVAVAIADRLSALLAENLRPGSEKSRAL
jgi:hypothetical protein